MSRDHSHRHSSSKRSGNKSEHRARLDIDQHGTVQKDGEYVYLTTPVVRMPFGVQIYGENRVMILEFVDDPDENSATRRFFRRIKRYEEDLERQLSGTFQSSVKPAMGQAGTRMRTRLLTERKGTVISEFVRGHNEVGAYEIKKGETGTLILRLQNVWTMDNDGTSSAGAIWVIVSGELRDDATDNNNEDTASDYDSHRKSSRSKGKGKNSSKRRHTKSSTRKKQHEHKHHRSSSRHRSSTQRR